MNPNAEPLEFRPAFPDEASRASFLDPAPWDLGSSHWFVAIMPGSTERLVGTVRYCLSPGFIDFRLASAASGELAGQVATFLDAWISFCNAAFAPSCLRHANFCQPGSTLDAALSEAGFEIRYREQHLETEWQEARRRILRVNQSLARKNGPFQSARILPARAIRVEDVMPLILADHLLPEAELRRMWNTPDPSILNRDLSACLYLEDRPVAAVLCAERQDKLLILAIAGNANIPGARRRALPMLLERIFSHSPLHSFSHLQFRANVEKARQTVNLALRTGGRKTGEAVRHALELGDTRG
jgi:hypothetical protein